jgi:formyl-CoA transferase
VFPTTNGHINIAVAGAIMFERCCQALGHPEWNYDKQFATSAARSKNRAEMNSVISEVTKTNTSEHWIELLNGVGCPAGPINSMDQVFADPQVQHLEMAVGVDHARLGKFDVVNQAIKMSRTPSNIRTASPDQGEHTDAILAELGYAESMIAQMHENGAV